jgi:cytochrome c1
MRMSRPATAFVFAAMAIALQGCDKQDGFALTATAADLNGNAERGAQLIRFYGCSTCHTIPGVQGADGVVGPPLNFFSRRTYIAGMLPNNSDNLVTWIKDPQYVVPGNVMPNMGVNDRDARDIASYLYTLK